MIFGIIATTTTNQLKKKQQQTNEEVKKNRINNKQIFPSPHSFTVPYVYPNTLHDHTNQTKNRTITTNSTSELNRYIQTNVAAAAAADVKSILMPASTSKYPIQERSVQQELYAKFQNFLNQWINTFVYLARKSKLNYIQNVRNMCGVSE